MAKTPEEISAIVACVAAVISLVALIVNVVASCVSVKAERRAYEAAERNNEIFVGQIENELRTHITDARNRYEDVSAFLEELTNGRRPDQLNAQEKRSAERVRTRMLSALENLLNAYENACGKYVDNKIDRTRFKKIYHGELRRLFENPEGSIGKLLNPEGTSPYKAIWKVYKEWYDLENQAG